MFIKAKKIKIVGDETVQLEIKVPKDNPLRSDDLPDDQSEIVRSLTELGWKEIEPRQSRSEYELATMEFQSYPLPHKILVQCERANNCPIKSVTGKPQDWKIKGRVIKPATVIESEADFMKCRITDDQIKFNYPAEQ